MITQPVCPICNIPMAFVGYAPIPAQLLPEQGSRSIYRCYKCNRTHYLEYITLSSNSTKIISEELKET